MSLVAPMSLDVRATLPDERALLAELALLGAPPPDIDDAWGAYDGGVRVTCLLCPPIWLHDEMPWHTTSYQIDALRAYVEHVREEHPPGGDQ